MSTLEQIQTDFQDYILGKAGAHAAIAACVNDQFGLGASERLAIYHDAYCKRMRASLGAAFEKTRICVGDTTFGELADGYMAAHPSRHANLRWFGDQFAPFVARSLPDCPFIGELAALEWALGIALDAPDAALLSVADLDAVPPDAWGDLVFSLDPAVHMLTLESNAGTVWLALNDDHAAPDGARLPAPSAWLVWRLNHQPHLRLLDAREAQALRALAEGATFGAMCTPAAGMGPVPVADDIELTYRMAGYLQNWLAQGLLRTVSALSWFNEH